MMAHLDDVEIDLWKSDLTLSADEAVTYISPEALRIYIKEKWVQFGPIIKNGKVTLWFEDQKIASWALDAGSRGVSDKPIIHRERAK